MDTLPWSAIAERGGYQRLEVDLVHYAAGRRAEIVPPITRARQVMATEPIWEK